jgi:hypothetical protein
MNSSRFTFRRSRFAVHPGACLACGAVVSRGRRGSKAHNLAAVLLRRNRSSRFELLTPMRSALVLFPVHRGLASEARSRINRELGTANSEPGTSKFPADSRLKILA